jgi:hypothetical protein
MVEVNIGSENDDWTRSLDAVAAEQRAKTQAARERGGHLCPNCHAWTPGPFRFDLYMADRSEGLCASCSASEAGTARRKQEVSNREISNLCAAMRNAERDTAKAGGKPAPRRA